MKCQGNPDEMVNNSVYRTYKDWHLNWNPGDWASNLQRHSNPLHSPSVFGSTLETTRAVFSFRISILLPEPIFLTLFPWLTPIHLRSVSISLLQGGFFRLSSSYLSQRILIISLHHLSQFIITSSRVGLFVLSLFPSVGGKLHEGRLHSSPWHTHCFLWC